MFTRYQPSFASVSQGREGPDDPNAILKAVMSNLSNMSQEVKSGPLSFPSSKELSFNFRSSSSSAQSGPFDFAPVQSNPFSLSAPSAAPSVPSESVGFTPFTTEIKDMIDQAMSEAPMDVDEFKTKLKAVCDEFTKLGYLGNVKNFESSTRDLLGRMQHLFFNLSISVRDPAAPELKELKSKLDRYRYGVALYRKVFGHFRHRLEPLAPELMDEVNKSVANEQYIASTHKDIFKLLRLFAIVIEAKIKGADVDLGDDRDAQMHARRLESADTGEVAGVVYKALEECSAGLDLIDRFAEPAFGSKATMDKEDQKVLMENINALKNLNGAFLSPMSGHLIASFRALAFDLENSVYRTGFEKLASMCRHLLVVFGHTYVNPSRYMSIFASIATRPAPDDPVFVDEFVKASGFLVNAAPTYKGLHELPGKDVIHRAVEFVSEVIEAKYPDPNRKKKTAMQLQREARRAEQEAKESPSITFATGVDGLVEHLAFSSLNQGLAVRCGNATMLFSFDDIAGSWRMAKKTEPFHRLDCMRFSPSGKVLVAIEDGELAAWDFETSRRIDKYEAPGYRLQDMSISSRGLIAATGNSNKRATGNSDNSDDAAVVVIWSGDSGKGVARMELPGSIAGPLQFSPDGQILAVVSSGAEFNPSVSDIEFFVHVYNAGELGDEFEYAVGPVAIRISDVLFSHDSKKMIVCYASPRVDVFDVKSGKLDMSAEITGNVVTSRSWSTSSLCRSVLSADGRYLFRAARRSICVLDLRTGKEVKKVQVKFDHVGPFVISPDGKTLACHEDHGLVKLFSTEFLLPRD